MTHTASHGAPGAPAPPSRVHAWLELARASNVATCASNVLVGFAIGWRCAVGPSQPWPETTLRVSAVIVAIVLLYVAGMILNDVIDADVDGRERPSRPIPSGRVSRRAAMGAATGFVVAALVAIAIVSPDAAIVAAGLIAAIVAYDLLHQRSGASVVLMGICRALVYAVAAAAAAWPLEPRPLTIFAVSIVLYIVALSTVARIEVEPDDSAGDHAGAGPVARRIRARAAPLLLLVAPLIPLLTVRPSTWPWTILAGVLLFVGIQRGTMHLSASPPRMRHAVMAWIAAISLVDAFFLCLLNQPILAAFAVGCWVMTTLAHRRVAGT